MKRFEVGHSYGAFDSGLDLIIVLKRTAHFITVRNYCGDEWRMMVRECEGKNGSRFEIATDRSMGNRWRDVFTYSAMLEE